MTGSVISGQARDRDRPSRARPTPSASDARASSTRRSPWPPGGGFDAVQMRAVAERRRRRARHALPLLPLQDPPAGLRAGRASSRGPRRALRDHPVTGASAARAGDAGARRAHPPACRRDPHLTEALTRAFMFADASVRRESTRSGRCITAMLTRAMAPDGDAGRARATRTSRSPGSSATCGSPRSSAGSPAAPPPTTCVDADRTSRSACCCAEPGTPHIFEWSQLRDVLGVHEHADPLGHLLLDDVAAEVAEVVRAARRRPSAPRRPSPISRTRSGSRTSSARPVIETPRSSSYAVPSSTSALTRGSRSRLRIFWLRRVGPERDPPVEQHVEQRGQVRGAVAADAGHLHLEVVGEERRDLVLAHPHPVARAHRALAGVTGEDVRGRVDRDRGVVDGGGRLAEADRDQPHLAGVLRDVAGGEDPGQAGRASTSRRRRGASRTSIPQCCRARGRRRSRARRPRPGTAG